MNTKRLVNKKVSLILLVFTLWGIQEEGNYIEGNVSTFDKLIIHLMKY